MKSLFDPVEFPRGPVMRNRFMMGPLTNMQSHVDGCMSDEEFRWLEMRTTGGFGMMSTCAAHIRANGQALAGQIGIFNDSQLPMLTRVASAMKAHGNIALTQINHAGLRANPELTGQTPAGPYAEPATGGRELTTAEIRELIEDFVVAAKRAEAAGFDGVEVHGAHAQLLSQFLDARMNKRDDGYGTSFEGRARAITEVLTGIRERCRPDFLIGLRLSTERYEINLSDFIKFSEYFMTAGLVDYLDMSLWDATKEPEDAQYRGRPLIDWAMEARRSDAKVAVSGKIRSVEKAQYCIDAGADFVVLGRAAILHRDFPEQARRDPRFAMAPLPVTVDYLHAQGVSDPFIGYLRLWDGFVADSGRGMYTELGTMVEGIDPSCFATEEMAELEGYRTR